MEEVVCKMLVALLNLNIVRGMKWQCSLEIHLKLCCPGTWSTGLLRFSPDLCFTKEMVKSKEDQGCVQGLLVLCTNPMESKNTRN